nr:glycosyltransferase family 2 protein [Kineosporia babensis]
MPAYNEAATIRTAVNEVLSAAYPCPVELIVVDDGSTDGTAQALSTISDPRLRVLRHQVNRGKGAALRTAIQAARGNYLLPFDADLEYRAEDISQVLAPVVSGVATVVYGPRLFGWNTVYQSFRYKIGNLATTLAANVLYDSALSDMHTCIKLVPLPLLRQMSLSEAGFGLDTEITAKVLRSGHRPFEVPVHYYSRTHGQGKKINWRDGVRCLVVLARVRFAAAPPRAERPIALRMEPPEAIRRESTEPPAAFPQALAD